jgi:RNA polymerase sigma factor for flagellar operon FliA
MDAIDRFDPLRGVPFKSYAEIRIQGSIYDSLRGDDWVPRSVRRKANRIDRARADFINASQRNPTREEMAESLQMTVDQYDALAADARINRLVSLDATTTEDGASPLADTLPRMDPSVEQNLCMDELGMEVEHAVACLPDNERVAVTLYYMQNMTLKEIGAVLGVTESRACQLRSQGVKRLQYRLRNAMP